MCVCDRYSLIRKEICVFRIMFARGPLNVILEYQCAVFTLRVVKKLVKCLWVKSLGDGLLFLPETLKRCLAFVRIEIPHRDGVAGLMGRLNLVWISSIRPEEQNAIELGLNVGGGTSVLGDNSTWNAILLRKLVVIHSRLSYLSIPPLRCVSQSRFR